MSENQSILKCLICGHCEPLPDEWSGNANCPSCKSHNTRVKLSEDDRMKGNPWLAMGFIFASCAIFWGGAYIVISALMGAN
jgi:hypothetical protein